MSWWGQQEPALEANFENFADAAAARNLETAAAPMLAKSDRCDLSQQVKKVALGSMPWHPVTESASSDKLGVLRRSASAPVQHHPHDQVTI